MGAHGAQKSNKVRGQRAATAGMHVSPYTKPAYVLGWITIVVMQLLYWTHRNNPEDQVWVLYCMMMTLFAAAGLFGVQMLEQQPLIPREYTKTTLNTGLRAAIIAIASMLTQFASQMALSFSNREQALYFVFAAVAEELFFRVLIITALLKLKNDLQMKAIAVFVQTIFFTAIHQNYYDNPPMLLSVFLGGLLLGFFFVLWRDPTANILAHFLLNLAAVQTLLVVI